MTPPRRAFVLKLELGADTRDDMVKELEQIARRILMDDMTTGVLGGPTTGYTYSLSVDETITHDDYFCAIEAWNAAPRGEK